MKFVERQREILNRALSANSDAGETVVRFEELTETRGQLADRLSEWLDIELSSEDEVDHRSHHQTSGGTDRSTERWRSEMPSEILEVFKEGMGDQISALGWRW